MYLPNCDISYSRGRSTQESNSRVRDALNNDVVFFIVPSFRVHDELRLSSLKSSRHLYRIGLLLDSGGSSAFHSPHTFQTLKMPKTCRHSNLVLPIDIISRVRGVGDLVPIGQGDSSQE